MTFDVTRNDGQSNGKFRAQIKSIDFAHFIPARLGNVLEDMTQLTQLTHKFVTPALVAPKASNLVTLNINTSTLTVLKAYRPEINFSIQFFRFGDCAGDICTREELATFGD